MNYTSKLSTDKFNPFILVFDKKKNCCVDYSLPEDGLIGNFHCYEREIQQLSEAQQSDLLRQELNLNGDQFLANISADFSFVFFNNSSSTIKAYRDHLGIFPLYYYEDEGFLIISTHQKKITDLPQVKVSTNDTWIGDALYKNSTYQTFSNEIKAVPEASVLTYKNNCLTVEKYWELTPSRYKNSKSKEEIIKDFDALLNEAILSRIPQNAAIGCEVSGGIDCTGIAGIVKRKLEEDKRPLYTYGHASLNKDFENDERDKIQNFVNWLKPNKHTFIHRENRGVLHWVKKAIAYKNGVELSDYNLYSQPLMEAAQEDNVDILFSGNGGDHCISLKFKAPFITAYIRKGRLKKAFQELKIIKKNSFVALYFLIKKSIGVLIKKPKKPDYSHMGPSVELVSKLKSVFPGITNSEKHYPQPPKTIEKNILRKLSHSDIEKRCSLSQIVGANYGLIYRYPYLDIRLLQFFIDLPYELMYNNGVNRWIYRETIKEYIPHEIAYQPKLPANMYGWIQEAFDFDVDNNNRVKTDAKDNYQYFNATYWNYYIDNLENKR